VVSSDDEKTDPVGVMVWQRWDRIATILSLLDGEKIDFIEYTEDDLKLIADALKPARVNTIEIKWRKAIVTMNEDQKALAIGKGASNIRLASILSGYSIEII
jgi:N utilization substance protein A